MPETLNSARVAFGLFEADLSTGELWRGGFKIKLQGQPFRVLAELVSNPGQVITREELQQRVWDKGTNVDFDHSLGTAVNKIREALGDNAENPRYVETLTRRGYRFIAPVRVLEPHGEAPVAVTVVAPSEIPSVTVFPEMVEAAATPVVTQPIVVQQLLDPAPAANRWLPWLIGLLVVVAGAGVGYVIGHNTNVLRIPQLRQITRTQRILPGGDAMESFPVTVTDGLRLFASVVRDGGVHLERITIRGGQSDPIVLPDEVAGPAIADISRDGSRLLVRSHASNQSEQPLFIVPANGGSAQRVMRVLAHDATYMPDDTTILYAAGNNLFETVISGEPIHYASLPGRAFWLRWSQDGKTLRFTLFDPLAHTQTLWELDAASRKAHPILTKWSQSHGVCCGTWLQNGDFVFQTTLNATSDDLWLLHAKSSTPERLTDGPLAYQGPVAARTEQTVFLTGVSSEGELQRLAPGDREFKRVGTFYSDASRVEETRDGKWIAWVDAVGRLWRARADGSELLQLSSSDLQVFSAHWSPDGSRISMMARKAEGAWSIYQELADGSDLEPLLQTASNDADPTWSPDGQSIALGQAPDLMGKDAAPRNIQILDLNSHQLTTLPGSTDLFSPRWSPDGRTIAAMSLDQRQLKLYDVATRQWRVLSSRSAADPVWSADSKFLYADAFMDAGQPVYRVGIADGHIQELGSMESFHSAEFSDLVFCGILHDGTVLVRARRTTANLYSLSLGQPPK